MILIYKDLNKKYETERREVRSPSYTKYSTPTRYSTPVPISSKPVLSSKNLIARLDPPRNLDNHVPTVSSNRPKDPEPVYVSKPREPPRRERTPPLLTPQPPPPPPPPTPVIETAKELHEPTRFETKEAEKKVLPKEIASTVMKPDLKLTEAIKIETPLAVPAQSQSKSEPEKPAQRESEKI